MGNEFIVPDRFIINSSDVLVLGPPADVGKTLLAHLAARIGRPDLSEIDLLDFGCGTRFSDSIINRGVPVKSYTGIDTNGDLIKFLHETAIRNGLSYHHFWTRSISSTTEADSH